MATPTIIGERHYLLAQEIRKTLAHYAELKDIIAMLGMEQLSPDDRAVVGRARRLERFLTQPFFATEQFTGIKGKGRQPQGCAGWLRANPCAMNSRISRERALHDRQGG
jgi:F0F1-type ATP synthase beta subunit